MSILIGLFLIFAAGNSSNITIKFCIMNKKIVPFEFVQVTNIVPGSSVSYQVYVNGEPKPCVIDENAIESIYNVILKEGIKELAKYFID